jgi:hypothetical protein
VGFWKRIAEKIKELDENVDEEKSKRALENSNKFLKDAVTNLRKPKAGGRTQKDVAIAEANSNSSKDARVKELIEDPRALSDLSDSELQFLRLTTQSDLEIYERDFSEKDREMVRGIRSAESEHQLSNPLVAPFVDFIIPRTKLKEKQDQIDNRSRLLKLINQEMNSREKLNKPHEPAVAPVKTQPSKQERRAELLVEIDQLRVEAEQRLKALQDRKAGVEEIKRYQNMYDDAIRQKEQQVRESLL